MLEPIRVDERGKDQHQLWTEFMSKEKCCLPCDYLPKPDSQSSPHSARVVCISDTHGRMGEMLHRIPFGDILIHCGDFTEHGTEEEILLFDLQLASLPHPHKIVIAGNHDYGFDDQENVMLRPRADRSKGTPFGYRLLKNCTYVQDRMIDIWGIRIFGCSWHATVHGGPFFRKRGEPLLRCWQRIPPGVDILITHMPPLGHSDVNRRGRHQGCPELLNVVERRVRPRYHVFGHVHEQNGVTTNGDVIFINASICDHQQNPCFNPVVFDMPLAPGRVKYPCAHLAYRHCRKISKVHFR